MPGPDPLGAEVAALAAELATLKGTVALNRLGVQALTQRVEALEGGVLALQSRVAGLEGEMDMLEAFVARLQTALPTRAPCRAWKGIETLGEE